jgi:hypothetical protein
LRGGHGAINRSNRGGAFWLASPAYVFFLILPTTMPAFSIIA